MLKKYWRFLDLKSDVGDYDEIHKTIEDGIIFKGTNLWLLVFAIIIASVGLNTNSTAVIIGAMLISPLMGPINGMGYAIATYDFVLFRRALNNFAFAVAAGLAASTLYFSLSPLSTAHSELLARTTPTIYDVLIALFGGLAGIVAISSRHKGNVIPGVAIATALMPPLCTAGYGIATAEPNYFFGAFYLFTINTVFIGISSVLFSQLLEFPIRKNVDPSKKKRINRWISVVILITIVPSVYFGYLLVQRERFSEKSNRFVNAIATIDGTYLLKHEINTRERTVTLTYGGDNLSNDKRQKILTIANEQGLDPAKMKFEQGFSFTDVNEDINAIDNSLRLELNKLSAQIHQRNHENDSLFNFDRMGGQLLEEVKTLYPNVSSLFMGTVTEFPGIRDTLHESFDSAKVALVVVTYEKSALPKQEVIKIDKWMRTRLQNLPNLKIVFHQQ